MISLKCNRKTSVKLNIVPITISTGYNYEVTNWHTDYFKWTPFSYLLTALQYFWSVGLHNIEVIWWKIACELECGDIFDNTNFLLVVHWNRASISNTYTLSRTVCEIIPLKHIMRHGLDLLGSRDLIGHVTTWGTIFYRCSIVSSYLQPFSRYSALSQCSRTHKRTNKQTWRIAIPPGGCNKIILMAFLLGEISWLAFKTSLKTNRIHHNIRGVTMTPASRWCNSRDVQRWTVHFGMSDVFQRFLGHLEPLNQYPSDATLAPLSILQNSRWRPRWPQSEWKLLK